MIAAAYSMSILLSILCARAPALRSQDHLLIIGNRISVHIDYGIESGSVVLVVIVTMLATAMVQS